MIENILFEEKQRPKQIWLWALMIGLNLLTLYNLFSLLTGGKGLGNHPASINGMVLITIFILVITSLVLGMTLRTIIKQDGIYVKIFPFFTKYKFYKWEEISNVYVRKYKPLLEYGGWGIRGFYKNRAFNISGNMGLQIEFKNGKKLLIGTHQPEELDKIINKIFVKQGTSL
ncbi:MAG: hypothetical protein J5I91_07215 [Bacteroidetes bacterium]|nr:hypothetical protein [Bacteroidota bacterium]